MTNKNNSRSIDMNTVKRLTAYLFQYKKSMALVIVCIIISSVASAASSLFLRNLVDDYIYPLIGVENPSYTALIEILIMMAGIYLAGIAANLIYQRRMTVIGQKIMKDIRDEMFANMQKLPIKFFDTHAHGDIMSLYTNDTDTLTNLLTNSVTQIISSLFTIVFVFVSMLSVSVYLTVLVIILTILVLMVSAKVTGQAARFFAAQQKSLAALDGYIEEMVNGQKVIKVFTHEEESIEGFNELNKQWSYNAGNAKARAISMFPMMGAFGYMIYIVIAIVGAALAINGVNNLSLTGFATLSIGSIVSFLTLTRSFTNPILQLSNQANNIIQALAGAGRIFNFLDEQPEVDEGDITLVNAWEDEIGMMHEADHHTGVWAWKKPIEGAEDFYVKLEGMVLLDHIDFSYVEGKQVLSDIYLWAEPGQKVAFVGATGAGKTTITNLINRFYDIDDGKIRYDGININSIKKSSLRRSMGIVLQDVNLFTGTVMENIRYGKLDATDEECIAAAKLANADDFIRMLPDGYNTVLEGDGSGLSQGQRQLLSIARAAVADPPCMILDEATSSIDTHTEAIVQEGMDHLMAGRTVFVIAHRLSTVQNSDVIMVLDHGRIIERGTHDSLIEQKGTYYQLYTGAFELE